MPSFVARVSINNGPVEVIPGDDAEDLREAVGGYVEAAIEDASREPESEDEKSLAAKRKAQAESGFVTKVDEWRVKRSEAVAKAQAKKNRTDVKADLAAKK